MVKGPLAGIQASWCFQRACEPFQLWSRLSMVSARVFSLSSRNGATLPSPPFFGCRNTGWPFGRVMARGSPNPRTPRKVPK